MQHKRFLSPALSALSLARQKTKKWQALKNSSALSHFEAIFRVARAARALLERVTHLLHAQLCQWVIQIVHCVLCVLLYDWQSEKDGVMGGHTRRSKQSVKASSTVLYDFAADLEDWKQQIKVKDSIPASQQRLTFTSQRTVGGQNFTLVKVSQSRQWQIVVDSSIEEVCNDLRSWRATLRSKNSSTELLQPLVLTETDELTTFLHNRTADELREIGVPCRVFFLSFNKCIPSLEKTEPSLSNSQPGGLDLKIDNEFRENTFLIDLHGNLNGLPIPVPFRYVMNGSQVATKLFMVEQTAQYREEQKQRYQHRVAPLSKDLSAEDSEGSIEAISQSSNFNDYVVEIEQDCEFTAFISRDHHRLRCIVLPVVTIPLVERKGNEELPFLYLPREYLIGRPRELTSSVLALPSTSEAREASSEVGEASNIAARSLLEGQSSATPDISTRKTTNKKKRRKAKKAAKENLKEVVDLVQDATVEAKSLSCSGALMKHAKEDGKLDSAECLKAENCNGKVTEDEGQLFEGNKLKHGSTSLKKTVKGYPLTEVENKVNSAEQRDVSVQSDQKQTCHNSLAASQCGSEFAFLSRNEHLKQKETADQGGQFMYHKTEADPSVSTSKNGGIKAKDTSVHKETFSDFKSKIPFDDHSAHGYADQRVIHSVQPASGSGFYSGSCSMSELAGTKKCKEQFHSKLQAEVQGPSHGQIAGGYSTRSYGFHNDRGDHASSHTKSMQQGFWAHRAADGQDFLPRRARVNQNSGGAAPGESRSSAPFWRHQRDGIPVSSNSWSKSRPSRADDWNSSRRYSAPIGQSRNMPAWEQLPNLSQPPNGSTFPIHWENHAPSDRPWSLSSRGQSYSSFNMQQRKLGKSNKVSYHFSDKWQSQGIPNDRIVSNMKSLTTWPETSSLCFDIQAEALPTKQTSSKDFQKGSPNNMFYHYSDEWQPQGMPIDRVVPNMKCSTTCSDGSSGNYDIQEAMPSKQVLLKELEDDSNRFAQGPVLSVNSQCKLERHESLAKEAIESCIDVQTTANTLNSSQDDGYVQDKYGLELPKAQVAEHVSDILEAVNASFESWGVYEQVSRLSGNSLCEFEKVAKAVAPSFKASTTQHIREPVCCLCGSLVSKRANGRHIPDVRLSTLWQWYEEPSSYGLKVKLSESSKRTGSNLQAFFVPYLSAIQLFGWSRKTRLTGTEDGVAAQGGLFDSHFLSQPIFSILLPRPEIVDDLRAIEGLPKQALISHQGVDSEIADIGNISSSSRQCHCDVELLYEFFEVEKPQQRRPLTDRIKELVSSLDVGSGDANLLNNAKINNLHPSSWFAVAWYPIYKIPDETFRSAFLTYHSLSCLQSTRPVSANTTHSMDTITAPVVGLMSYNAQVKDWFYLSSSCNVVPDDVLQQYLAKLEAAATTMARGSCEKSANFKHSDFAFFQSRGR